MTVAASAKIPPDRSELASSQGRISVGNFFIVVAQLCLLALVLRQFQIESGAFLKLALLAFTGFTVHALLPLGYRLPFFLLLSLASVALILGFGNAAWLVGIGLILIGICHIPASFTVRAALLISVGALLTAMRATWLPFLWSEAIWPILGSMFMFRLVIYFYDLRHDSSPVSVTRTLSYFFMLPNVCFPLYPVIDFKTFRRNYFDQDAYQIYQVGVAWILRGAIHLILYRLVYNHLVLAPSEVIGPADLVRYLISNFLLYLRISGQFHIIVGMLYLFGFRLPETHHLYYLASSFTDFWRRINIYWKDFMLKVFYRPAYFALRKRGETAALILATLLVFAATWLLHSYQWFWLRGNFPINSQDGIFWAVLAVLVVWNSLREAKYGRERSLGRTSQNWRRSVGLGIRTAGTFSGICILWSLWTSESISEWVELWSVLIDHPLKTILGGIAFILIAGMVLGMGFFLTSSVMQQQRPESATARLRLSSLMVVITSSALLFFGSPQVYTGLGDSAATVIDSLRSSHLNRLDMARMERGYYEELLSTERLNSQLGDLYMQKPGDWLEAHGIGLARPTGDFLQRELAPMTVAYTSRVTVRTNRWGMRDKDYEKIPLPGAFRIAMLGSSTLMGYGVQDLESFEVVLEEKLNREPGRAPYATLELLNFGVSNYKPLQQLRVLEKALSFSPHAVFYVATLGEEQAAARYLVQVVKKHIKIPYPHLEQIVQKAGVTADMSETEGLRRLKPHQRELLEYTYRYIVATSKARNAIPVWIQLPMPTETHERSRRAWEEEMRLAQQAGFSVISLEGAYDGHELSAVRLAAWDNHPNTLGHRLIAERFYRVLQEQWTNLFGVQRPSLAESDRLQ